MYLSVFFIDLSTDGHSDWLHSSGVLQQKMRMCSSLWHHFPMPSRIVRSYSSSVCNFLSKLCAACHNGSTSSYSQGQQSRVLPSSCAERRGERPVLCEHESSGFVVGWEYRPWEMLLAFHMGSAFVLINTQVLLSYNDLKAPSAKRHAIFTLLFNPNPVFLPSGQVLSALPRTSRQVQVLQNVTTTYEVITLLTFTLALLGEGVCVHCKVCSPSSLSIRS